MADTILTISFHNTTRGTDLNPFHFAPPKLTDTYMPVSYTHLDVYKRQRQCYPLLDGYRKMLAPKPAGGSGLTGTVTLCHV